MIIEYIINNSKQLVLPIVWVGTLATNNGQLSSRKQV